MAVFDENGTITDVEKPQLTLDLAIGGICIFDERFWTPWSLQEKAILHSDADRLRPTGEMFLSVGEETWVDCGT